MASTILLVEPAQLLSRATTRLLGQLGHRVFTLDAHPSTEELESVRCIVVDEGQLANVPVVLRNLPRVVLTTLTAHVVGGPVCLAKPFDRGQLEDALDRATRREEASGSLLSLLRPSRAARDDQPSR